MVLPPNTADTIAGIVASLRPIHDDLALPDTTDILREAIVSDGRGGEVVTWTTVATSRCALDVSGQAGTGEYVVGSVETVDLPYVVTLPYGTDVTTDDRFLIDGRTFEISTVRSGEGYEIAVTALCREVV